MKRRLFFAGLAALLVLAACDDWNLPVKEKMAFLSAMAPVESWAELGAAVASGAELIALTKSFPAEGAAAISVTRPLAIAAAPGLRAVITRTVFFTAPFFEVGAGGALTLGHPSGGTLVLDGSEITVPASLITMSGGSCTIRDGAELRNNRKEGDGGAVSAGNSGGTVIIRMYGGIIEGNKAVSISPDDGYGGGVGLRPIQNTSGNAVFEMYGGIIRGNEASRQGGGVSIYNTNVGNNTFFTLYGGTISGNAAAGGGGGVHDNAKGFTMEGGNISGNTASGSGASGGGVYTYNVFTMNGGTIERNEAENAGGGVEGNIFTLKGGTISGNEASKGGGVSAGRLFMSGGVIRGNTAGGSGGGVFISGNTVIGGGFITENGAGAYGGGVYVSPGTGSDTVFTLEGGTISGNTAGEGGGGICLYAEQSSASLTMNGGTISGNSSGAFGGGVYGHGNSEFIKKPKEGESASGIIYGSDGDDNKNASASEGHAVYMDGSPPKKREATAGEDTDLDSTKDINGGWDQ